MKTLTTLLLLIVGILIPVTITAQAELNSPAPIDPDIRIGRLNNGLTYFIRKNKEPEKRASFYFIQNVGAILETDEQNGLAHFLEHMAFNGTTHFPGKGIINSLEKHGVAFGSNINAYTGHDETVYNLSDVPVDAPGLMDTCLLVLFDWSANLLLTNEEIDAERGVITEEWRTRRDADFRMMKQFLPILLKDSRYAVRDVIGDLDVIKNFKYNALRNYYHEWYRTDLQAIAVVGDFDVNEMENKIKSLFSQLKPNENPQPRPVYEVPFHKETRFGYALDKEASQTSVDIYILHKAADPASKNKAYVREQYADYLMNLIMSTRISELLQKENPPFIRGNVVYTSLIRGYDAMLISATARKNEEAIALEAVYSEAERAKKFGFTNGELGRAKAKMISDYETRFKQKDKIDNDTYIAGIQNYFLTGEPLTSMDFDYEFLLQVIDDISVDELSSRFRKLMAEENRTIIVQGLEGSDIIHLTETEALGIIAKVGNSALSAYVENALDESLINEELTGSKIIKTVALPQFDAVEWTLANNSKVIYRKADYEKDNIILTAFSFGGISLLDNDLVIPATLLPGIAPMYGAGIYDNITLQKMLAGKKASVTISLGETTESVSGSSTPKDFETMMQLLYLRMAKPRFDKVAHDAIIGRFSAMIGNMEKDPDKIKSDSISLITTGYNPRTPVMTRARIDKITLNDIQKIYTDRFNSGDEFTFFLVGNVEKETVIPMVEKYIGSLPSKGRSETWIDRQVVQPKGKITREISLPLTVPKSTVFISFAENLKYEPENYLALEVIQGVLDIVFTEKVREDEGGTYGVGLSLSAQQRPEQLGEGIISFDCDPARANALKTVIYRELENLMKTGPSKENLDKAVNNIIKTREENKLHNAYWSGVLSSFYSYGINSNDPANYEDILHAFTVKDIRKAAVRMFQKADVVDLIFKPLN
jgi:zinc protease